MIRRITALVEIARWLWVVNLIVLAVALVYRSYEVAALAGFTGIMALVGAAIGRHVERCLGDTEETAKPDTWSSGQAR